jgi:ketosteroid isomerase-like protein
MASVTELINTWKEALANQDSSRLAEFFTEDFRFVGATTGRNETKQETLDWVASNPRCLSIGNLEVIYENDEVGVVLHDADSGLAELGKGKVMAVYTKRMVNSLRLGS